MNEINLNPLGRSVGLEKSYSAGQQKNVSSRNNDQDTVELSALPDLSAIEAAVEEEFTQRRNNLEEKVNSASYPPLETIDRLAAMFAMNLETDDQPLS